MPVTAVAAAEALGGLSPLPGAQLVPLPYEALAGWRADDHAAAFQTFRASCAHIQPPVCGEGNARQYALQAGLARACKAARALGWVPNARLARLFFEAHFEPVRIVASDTGRGGFFTGYYEPEVAGALTQDETYNVPVLARPTDLVETPEGVRRQVADAALPAYFTRAEIEDGALAGRGLEIAYLKDPVDLFFMQIQGSARLRLPDGRVMRLNYAGKNGHPYVAVGRELIAKGLVPREEMSMARIRAYMTAHPQAGRALRRLNPSYVFFQAVDLKPGEGPMGAQGVPLTAGRSLAVDRRLHVYGSPVYVDAELPLSAPGKSSPFQRLMIAQDTGSAIIGPARGDIYFGAGPKAATQAGRMRHGGNFTLLVPRFLPAEGECQP
ncbi:murein transglycosylase A [Xanthobacter sp. TB0139]|uniref:murein transglycosylase A n=1 Tax=Xanthobacter sp. TB0139 TaxID=3459178 RepID=UPI004039810E